MLRFDDTQAATLRALGEYQGKQQLYAARGVGFEIAMRVFADPFARGAGHAWVFSPVYGARCYHFGIMLKFAMPIIALSTLRTFWECHPDAETPLRSWYALASRAVWKIPADIKAAYGSVSFTGNNRVVFNIKGNDYRLVVAVRYDKGLMYVRFVGTHRQYDKIDVETI